MVQTLFFSWQSDTTGQTKILRKAINGALKEVKRKTGVSYQLDEATRGLSGSPDIKRAILDKIDQASIFVADVTTVAGIWRFPRRPQSNSNVMFELGYANAILGEGRVITVTSKGLNLLPFDIARNRATPLDDNIVEALTVAIKRVHRKNPPNAFERHVVEPARRANDRKKVEDYLALFPKDLLSTSIGMLPYSYDVRIAEAADALSAKRYRIDFELPDPPRADFDQLLHALNELMELGGNNFLIATWPLYRCPKPHEAADADEIQEQASALTERLRLTMAAFLSSVENAYPDIDFDQVFGEADAHYRSP